MDICDKLCIRRGLRLSVDQTETGSPDETALTLLSLGARDRLRAGSAE